MSPFPFIILGLVLLLVVMLAVSMRAQKGPQGHGDMSAESALREADSRLRDHGNLPAYLPRDKRGDTR